jgi:hypothetical protein
MEKHLKTGADGTWLKFRFFGRIQSDPGLKFPLFRF